MQTHILPVSEITLQKACDLLVSGKAIAIPTETVYGLAADATNDHTIAQIFAIKERPLFSPLIIQVSTLEEAQKWVEFPSHAIKVAERFWPGPLTLVLPKKPGSRLSDLVSAGLNTLGMRITANPFTLHLLQRIQRPLAVTSANHFANFSPTCAEDVLVSLKGKIPLIVDGGHCSVGIESTILDLSETQPRLLRSGSITVKELEPMVGSIAKLASNPKTPGFIPHHTPLRLNATTKYEEEVMLGFGPDQGLSDLNLSPEGNLETAAIHFFRMLHDLDTRHARAIAVMPIPNVALGIAINDRLKRMCGD